ncbi:MAG: SIMPL domain-containing protein [Ignavibacteriaceae bacterium]
MRFILSLVFLVAFYINIYPQDNKFIEVTGTAVLEVPADEVIWNINIRKIAKTFEDSRNQCYKSVDNLVNILKAAGIKDSEIDIPPLQQSKEYEYLDRERIFKGFVTSVIIKFKQKDLSAYGVLSEELSKSEEYENISTSFNDSMYEEHHKQALKNAALSARDKADYLLQELNLQLGDIIEITEISQAYPSPFNRTTSLSVGDAESQAIGGNITYSRSIKIKFNINNK